ncbi:MAG: hypothetical protein KF846_13610 [Cyclobacteriaceae bacterium]|nr:hypothetical protein [Cyclobacteriaceae bacterium]MBX2957194.1 hypothetical protein [Cyclobacteriaceae bacterium]
MKAPLTSQKARYQKDFRKILSQKRSRRRLISSNINIIKISVTVKRITDAFKDHKSIITAWNSLPSLFDYRGKIEKLIDAKYLAAIQKLNSIQENDMQLSEIELYYTWLLFQFENGKISTALFSLEDFSEFQESWRLVVENNTHVVSPDDENDTDLAEQIYDPHQLKINL